MIASKIKILAKDSFVYGLSGMLVKLVGFILFPLFARKFTPEIYGIVSVLNSLNLVLLAVSNMGIEAAAFRWFYDKDDPKFRTTIFVTWFYGQLFISAIISVFVILFFKHTLEIKYLKIGNGGLLVWIVLLNLLLNIVPSIFNLYFMIHRKPAASLFVSFGLVLLTAISTLTLVFIFNLGVRGFYLGQSISLFIITVIGILYFIKRHNHFVFDFNLWKQMLGYGVKLVPATISNQFLLFLAVLIIQPLTSQADLGYFQVGYTLASGILFFTSGFAQAFSPYALSLAEEEMIPFSTWVFDIYVSLMIFICFTVSIFYKEIITLLLSAKYLDSVMIAGIFTFANFIVSLNTVASLSLVKRKNVGIYGRVIFIFNAICLGLIYLFTKTFGITGAPIAFLLSQFLAVLFIFYYAQKTLYIPYALTKNILMILLFLSLYFIVMSYNTNGPRLMLVKFAAELLVLILFLGFNSKHFYRVKMMVAELKQKKI